MLDPDAIYGALDDAVRRGEISEKEAREEYFAAEEEAAMEIRERWA